MMATPSADRACTHIDEDELERKALTLRVASKIRDVHDPQESVVFGLVGAWGSGKTTLINFVVEELRKPSAQSPKWQVAHFSPWASGDAEGLMREFYSALTAALPRLKWGSFGARRAVARVLRASAPASALIPQAGIVAPSILDAIGSFLGSTRSWDKYFKKASRRLHKLKTPVLLIVDDVDRLQPDELMALLKVVRLLGRFPGVDYLLAYDHGSVARVISKALVNPHTGDEDFAARFVEKIVQHPFDVPLLRRDQVVGRLAQAVEPGSVRGSLDEFATRGWYEFESLFATVLSTPRAVDRYAEQHRIARMALTDGEFDPIDLDLAVLLHTRFPAVFAKLTSVKDELILGRHSNLRFGDDGRPDSQAFDVTELLGGLESLEQRQARRILNLLFPETTSGEEIAVRSGNVAMRMAHEDYFDRYVASELSPIDVSDQTVQRAVRESASGGPDMLVGLLIGRPAPIPELVLTKSMEYLERQPIRSEERLAVLRAAASALGEAASRSSADSRFLRRLVAWTSELVAILPPTESAPSVQAALEPLRPSGIVFVVMKNAITSREARSGADDARWRGKVENWLALEAQSQFVEHLKRRDDAGFDHYVISALHFALDRGRGEATRTAVAGAFARRDATVEDLAARFVEIRGYYPRPDQLVIADDGSIIDGFGEVLPTWEDPWFDLPTEADVDLKDVSWANRRLAARGRFRRP
jgi:hypothetical protein